MYLIVYIEDLSDLETAPAPNEDPEIRKMKKLVKHHWSNFETLYNTVDDKDVMEAARQGDTAAIELIYRYTEVCKDQWNKCNQCAKVVNGLGCDDWPAPVGSEAFDSSIVRNKGMFYL